MPCISHPRSNVTRRQAVKHLSILSAGLGLGCTPLRMALSIYPEEFDERPDRVDRILRAFVDAVVPGIDADNAILAFHDDYYPLARFRRFFASDLCERAAKRCGTDGFEFLERPLRLGVIRDGERAGGTTTRLYRGAIFLTQVASYAGIYDAEGGCPLIAFDGRFRNAVPQSYPDAESFLARSVTADGNPA